MSATSSRRRQLSDYVRPPGPPRGTTGAIKGPARSAREADLILGRKRIVAQLEHEAGPQLVRLDKRARLRRFVFVSLAVFASVLVLALLAHFVPNP